MDLNKILRRYEPQMNSTVLAVTQEDFLELVEAIQEARSTTEMAIFDEIDNKIHGECYWYFNDKQVVVEPEVYAQLRLTELRQNVADVDFGVIHNWNQALIIN